MITPVVVFSVKPAGTVTPVKVTVLKVAGVNTTPFTVSLSSTLVVVPPGVPLIGVGVSFTASMVFTTTLAVAVSQITGVATVQIW